MLHFGTSTVSFQRYSSRKSRFLAGGRAAEVFRLDCDNGEDIIQGVCEEDSN